MYRGSKYHLSQASLEYFAKKFNSLPCFPNIQWIPITEETFDNDGYFIDAASGKTLGYDWEIRDEYFSDGKFAFDSLGQFERKLAKPSIKLSIQSDTNCFAIIVGWHEDFLKEEVVRRELATDDENNKENGKVRYTEHFMIYKFTELDLFKKMISIAFEKGVYNHTVFAMSLPDTSKVVIGNRKNNSYHRVGCQFEPMTADKRVIFNCKEEAEKNGYKRCTTCKP